MRAPAKQIHFIYLCGAFLITVLATLHSQLAERRSELREEPSAAAEDFDRPLDVLKYVLAVLPILLSVVLNLRKDLDLEQKAGPCHFHRHYPCHCPWPCPLPQP